MGQCSSLRLSERAARPVLALFMLLTGLLLVPATAARAQQSIPPAPSETGAVIVGDRVVVTLRASVGTISAAERAAIVNRRIERILTDPNLRPEELEAVTRPSGNVFLMIGDLALIEATQRDAEAEGTTPGQLAQTWTTILRDTLTQVKPIYRPKAPPHPSFVPLLILAGLAFLVPLLASRFKKLPIPVVVGEILLGIVIGRSGFDLIHYDSRLQFLSEFGLAYLMFLSGLEVDIDLLTERPSAKNGNGRGGRGGNPLVIACAVVGLTLAVSLGVAFGLVAMGLLKQPWMMMLILSTVSLGLVVPILKERGMLATRYGQTLLVTALVADVVTMFLITIIAGWMSSGPTLKLFLGLGLIVVFAIALRVGHVLARFPAVGQAARELSELTAQVPVRASLVLMLAFVALSEGLGTEVILGAFLAGFLIAVITKRQTQDLFHKLEALGFGFFIPIFFIMVGVRFDLQSLISNRQGLLLALLLIPAAFLVKLIGGLLLRPMAGSWKETIAGGMLIAPGLSLIIAAAEIGLRLGLFSQAVYSALICVTLITGVFGPMGFQLLMPKTAVRESRRALIVGAGEMGALLAARLQGGGWDVTLLEKSDAPSKQARSAAGVTLVTGDGTNPDDLRAAGLEGAQAVIAVTDSDAANEIICRIAQEQGIPRRLALIRGASEAERLREQEIAMPVTPLLSALSVLEAMVTHPGIFELLTSPTPGKRVTEVTVERGPLVGRALRDIGWPGDVLILSIRRADGEIAVPRGMTVIRSGDTLTLIGSEGDVDAAVALADANGGASSPTRRRSPAASEPRAA